MAENVSSRAQQRPHAGVGTGSHRELARGPKDAYFRNLYTKAPDFRAMALNDPEFAALFVFPLHGVQLCLNHGNANVKVSVKGRGRDLNFSDPKAVMQLTKTLLKVDFDLSIELPEDRLCPPVMNRHNYILWLKDLLDTTSYDEPGRKAVGLDIGTGASCIYPLLGCAQRDWSFIATDIDAKSLECAKNNVKLNDLESRVRVIGRKPDDALIPLDDLKMDAIDFTMTNPPFYESTEAMLESAAGKSRPPFTACTGAEVEMVTEGGEIGFISRIFEESLVLRERIQWYTAMVGFLSSITKIVDKLWEHKIDNYAITEFTQGNKTRRWAIAWSFQPLRPAQSVARGTKAALSRNILPPMTETTAFKMPLRENIGGFAESLSNAIAALELISWNWNKEKLEGVGRAVDKVWSRPWRRQKKREAEMQMNAEVEGGGNPEKPSSEVQVCQFGFKVAVRVARDHVSVEARWLEGHDEVALESFRGFLKTASEKAVEDIKKA